jgi:FAD-linked oxidoreductase
MMLGTLLRAFGADVARTRTVAPSGRGPIIPDAWAIEEAEMTGLRWRNWSGAQQASPSRILAPVDEGAIVEAVRAAARRGETVRVAGSGHSFTPLVPTDGTMLRLDRHAGLVAVDVAAGTAIVRAGTTIRALGPLLAAHGLALANQGDIDAQAIAGAVGTGTHGTGAALGSLSSQVTGLRLVTASGEPIACDAVRERDLFDAARVNLGVLGAVSELTLRVRPAYRLVDTRWREDLGALLDRIDALGAQHRHFEFFWFPHADEALVKTLDETDEPATPRRAARVASEVLLENAALWVLCELARNDGARAPKLGRFATRTAGPTRHVDISSRVFASARLVRFNEMEYALPRDAGPDCVREIRAWIEASRPGVVFPIEYRLVAADDIWLSPFQGRASCTIAVHQYAKQDWRPYFDAIEAIFRNHRGRPHWGKLHTRVAGELADLYPHWDDFRRVRRVLDPDGRFLNPYLRSLLGE